MRAITADDIAGAIGLPFASATDEAWAEVCAASATVYISALPLAADPWQEPRLLHGGTMLATWYYRRRPDGTVSPDFGFTPTTDEVQAFQQALGIGRHQPLDVLG